MVVVAETARGEGGVGCGGGRKGGREVGTYDVVPGGNRVEGLMG